MENGLKKERYIRIHNQLMHLFSRCKNPYARMSSINALLFHKMESFSWVGFYLLQNGRLLVGSYQGPLACIELEKNKGVCWKCIKEKKTIIIPDVEEFEDHIACDPKTKSEIAIPLIKNSKVIGVLDVDSKRLSNFDETDKINLERIVSMIYD